MIKVYDYLIVKVDSLADWLKDKRNSYIQKKIDLKQKEYALLIQKSEEVSQEKKELEALLK